MQVSPNEASKEFADCLSFERHRRKGKRVRLEKSVVDMPAEEMCSKIPTTCTSVRKNGVEFVSDRQKRDRVQISTSF